MVNLNPSGAFRIAITLMAFRKCKWYELILWRKHSSWSKSSLNKDERMSSTQTDCALEARFAQRGLIYITYWHTSFYVNQRDVNFIASLRYDKQACYMDGVWRFQIWIDMPLVFRACIIHSHSSPTWISTSLSKGDKCYSVIHNPLHGC